MYQTKNLGLNITEIDKDSLQAFNFDIDLGDNFKAIDEKTLSHRNITNCLLEVPQDIKLELVDGVVTLKEGSKVYVPNGPGIFEEVNINSDISFAQPPYDGVYMLFINPSGNIQRNLSTLCFSGSTAPTDISNYTFWYDTTNNLVKFTTNGGANWEEGYSLPFCIVTAVANTSVSIDQVFNGFGYIGSTAFALPGVKGLIPDGRNEDGSYFNILYTIPNLTIQTYSDISHTDINLLVNQSNELNIQFVEYNENNNELFDGLGRRLGEIVLAKLSFNQGAITSFKPKKPFHAVDYFDYSTKITELEAKIEALQAAVEALQG